MRGGDGEVRLAVAVEVGEADLGAEDVVVLRAAGDTGGVL